jgi:hypothetical protein
MSRIELANGRLGKRAAGSQPFTDREWLEIFKRLGDAGQFCNEPDFQTALELYRDAIERGDFRPVEWEWLAEIYSRVREGKIAVTEAEYHELGQWYWRNESVVYRVDLRFALQRTGGGPRRSGATETVEDLRLLRAAHPELK